MVAIGTDVEAGILATYILVDLKIPRIWAKAITRSHGAILERVGAHRVVFAERDMGIRVAHTLPDARSTTYLPRTRILRSSRPPCPKRLQARGSPRPRSAAGRV